MPSILIPGGSLYQWDSGRQVKIIPDENTTISEIHFCKKDSDTALISYTSPTSSDALIADIPDVLLQEHGVLIVYAMITSNTGRYTKYDRSFSITKRGKPDDYVYTESDYTAYYILSNRIDDLQKQLVTTEDLNSAVQKALQEMVQSGDFKGEQGEPGSNGLSAYEVATKNGFKGNELEWLASLVGSTGATGKDGYTPVKGIDYFDGAPGAKGEPGYTPIKGVDYFDGKDGSPGIDGKTPVKGTDYFTADDKAEMVSAVLVALPVYNGEVSDA